MRHITLILCGLLLSACFAMPRAFANTDYLNDANESIIIDPWATYYGGSMQDLFTDVAVDGEGNIYVCGRTYGGGSPVLNAAQATFGGYVDAVVGKFSSSGTLLWMTYFGGSDNDRAAGIAVDASGNVAVSGLTWSADLPTRNAYQASLSGSNDAFVAVFNTNGQLQWASYYGGSGSDWANAVAFDPGGNCILAGVTASSDFPVSTSCYQWTFGGTHDGFIVKMNATGGRVWATFLGGGDSDGIQGLCSDAGGNIHVSGNTRSAGLPTTVGACQSSLAGNSDVYVAKFSPACALLASTYYGGTGYEDGLGIGTDINTDASGNVLLAFETNSTDIPTTSGAWQSSLQGGNDAFVVKLDPACGRIWATYAGGSQEENVYGSTVDGSGNVIVIGRSSSTSFPFVNAHQSVLSGGDDAFIFKLNANGTPLWSTLLGGAADDQGRAVSANAEGDLALIGWTESQDFPLSPPSCHPYYQGAQDGFLSTFTASGTGPALRYATIAMTPNPTVVNQQLNTLYLGIGAQSVTLTAGNTSGYPVTSYLWSTSEMTSSISISPVVPTTYSVTITDANNNVSTCWFHVNVVDVRCGPGLTDVTYCENGTTKCDTERKALQACDKKGATLGPCAVVNQDPVAVASVSPTSGAPPLTVDFSSSGSYDPDGSITGYHWDFDDGNSSTDANPTHTYPNTGTYEATLTVTDNDNATGTDQVTITVSTVGGYLYVESQLVTRQYKPGNKEFAQDVVIVRDNNGQAAGGAVVTADYSGPTSGTVTGTTGANGEAVLESSWDRNPGSIWCFTVTDVRKSGYSFNTALSHLYECEGSSSPKVQAIKPVRIELDISPHPVRSDAVIAYTVPEPGHIAVRMYDLLGREVATPVDAERNIGRYTTVFVPACLPSGIYILSLDVSGRVLARRLFLLK